MKKLILTFSLLIVLISQHAFAQYQKGDMTLNAGISVGLIGYNWGLYGNSSGFLPLSANLEYSINDMIAVGPYLGYYARSYNYGSGYKDRFSAINFGARGTFHASEFLNEQLNFNINAEKLDLYGTLMLGIETYRWKTDESWSGDNYYANGSRVIFAPVVGARYNFTPSFGAFTELGRGAFGVLTLGASARF